MSTVIENSANTTLLDEGSRHFMVLSSTGCTTTSRLKPRMMRDVAALKDTVLDFPYFPLRRDKRTAEGVDGYSHTSESALASSSFTFMGSLSCDNKAHGLFELIGGDASASGADEPRNATSRKTDSSEFPLPTTTTQTRREEGRALQLGIQHPDQLQQPFLWVDVKRPTKAELDEVLSWFPLHAITLDKLSMTAEIDGDDDAGDQLELFPAQGYVFLSLTGTPPRRSDERPATVVFLLFEQVLLTLSDASYPGEEDVLVDAMDAANGESHDSVGISSIFSAIVSSLILETQRSVTSLMIDVDQLDELVLQIQPSEMDQNDMLTRIRGMRHRVAGVHTSLLLKERVLKQLLLPTLRATMACRDARCVERYQSSLTRIRGTVERLRKARDTVNLSCMNLVSGVSARLVQHCHWMDYLNHVQSQVSLVVMPVAVIPGLWASNVRVPWEETETTKAFWGLVTVTLSLFALGMIYPIRKYFAYKPPGALVPSPD